MKMQSYLKEFEKKGYNLNYLHNHLIDHGYDEKYVSKEINRYKTNNTIKNALFFLLALALIISFPFIKPNIIGYVVYEETESLALSIWSSNTDDGIENTPIIIGNAAYFYADLIDNTSQKITGANCQITVEGDTITMGTDNDLYAYSYDFDSVGDYDYSINCEFNGDEITAYDTVSIEDVPECGSDFYIELSPPNPLCGDTINLKAKDNDNCLPINCWENYNSVTLSLPSTLSTVDSLTQSLSSYDNEVSWQLTCDDLTSDIIEVTLSNGQEKCIIQDTIDITEFSTNPNMEITIPQISDLRVGDETSITITIENTGDDTAINIEGTISSSDSDKVQITNDNINIQSLAPGEQHEQEITITPQDSGNVILSINSLSYKRSDGKKDYSVSAQSNTFTILSPPILSSISNIEMGINTQNDDIDLNNIFSDPDAADTIDTVRFTIIDSGGITADITTDKRILLTPGQDWTGTETITLIANDTQDLSTSTSFQVSVIEPTLDIPDDDCDNYDDDNDGSIDEDYFGIECCGYDNCNPNGTFRCINGREICEDDIEEIIIDEDSDNNQQPDTIAYGYPTPPPQEPIIPIEEQPAEITRETQIALPQSFKITNIKNKIKHEIIVDYIEGKTRFIHRIKNVNLLPVKDVRLKIEIPKSILESADDIISSYNFNILKNDPVIEFKIGDLNQFEYSEFSLSIPKILSLEDINSIFYDLTQKEKSEIEILEELNQLEKNVNKTKEVVKTNITFKVDEKNNETILDIDFQLNENVTRLENVSIVLEIPKCMLEYLKELETGDSNFEAEIQDTDPIIVWHLNSLIGEEKVRLALKTIADEDCLNQAKVVAIARDILFLEKEIDYNKVFSVIFLSILLFAILIFFSRYTRAIEHEDKEVEKIYKSVKRLFHQGYNEEYITEQLKSRGLTDKQVEKIMSLNSKGRLHYWILRLGVTGEELIFICIGALHFMNFLGMLPGDLDYVKKLISWTLMALIFYHVSITKILFGFNWAIKPFYYISDKLKNIRFRIDVLILIAYFSLIIKQIIGIIKVSAEPDSYVFDFYNFIISNGIIIERAGMILALLIIIILSFILAGNKKIERPSLANLIGLKGFSESFSMFIIRFIAINLLLLFFFYVVFEKMTEWLALAIDAPLFILSIPVAGYLIFKHRHKFAGKGIFKQVTAKVSTFLDKYYENFIQLFHYRKTIILGFTGILLLHILTEVLIFIIPYITSKYDPIYFGNFNENHLPIFFGNSLLQTSLSSFSANTITIASILYTYIMNILGFLSLVFILGYIWFSFIRNSDKPFYDFDDISNSRLLKTLLPLMVSSIIVFIWNPCFKMVSLYGDNIIGVDIQTQFISNTVLYPVVITSIVSFILSIALLKFIRKFIVRLVLTSGIVFFIYYIFLYYSGVSSYFTIALSNENLILTSSLFIFSVFSILLYPIGTLIFTILSVAIIWNIRLKILENLFHLHVHSIHHYETHEEHIHGEKEDALLDNIIENLKEGHHLFIISEHLLHYGWPINLINKAILKARKDKRWSESIKNLKNIKHADGVIKELSKWIDRQVKNGYDIDDIIKHCMQLGYTEEDIIEAYPKKDLKGVYKKLLKEDRIEKREQLHLRNKIIH